MNATAAIKLARKVPTALYVVGGVAVLLLGWQVLKALRGLGKGISDTVDRGAQGIADAYVAATSDPVDIAEGIMLVLPNGSRVPQRLTTPAGGGKFKYLGATYEIVEALGAGSYRARLVG